MKKLKKMIPTVFFTFATIAAFTTHSMSRQNSNCTMPVQGYFKGNAIGTICNTAIECSASGGQICTSGGVQVWGFDANDKCLREIYRLD